MLFSRASFGLLTLALAMLGCRSATEQPISDEVGVIHFYGDTAGAVRVPASASAGADFMVTIKTFGNGCVSAAGAGIRYATNAAVLTPYDNQISRVRPGVGCPDVLIRPEHNVSLRFPNSGIAEIRVEGRRLPDGAAVVIQRTISITD